MKIYDLRSDTITKPSLAMRKAMYDAEVGDDVYLEDPTVNKLQEMAVEITGKKKALFVSSGTMGNLISLMILSKRNKQVLLDSESHIIHYELGGVSSIAGLMPLPIKTERGFLTKKLIENHLIQKKYDMSNVNMVSIENTHNRYGGSVYPIHILRDLYSLTKSKNVHLHIDGARIFNASIASKTSVKDIANNCDSITFCLSKGLGSPFGSILCGDEDFINEAYSMRKLLGGGLRQSGIMAAAGIYALENNISLLEEDHIKIKKLANTVLESGIGKVNLDEVETNILIFNTEKKASDIVAKLDEVGIRCIAFDEYRVRFVSHLNISMNEIDEVCDIIKKTKF